MKRLAGTLSKFSKSEVQKAFQDARCRYKSPAITVLSSPKQHELAHILVVTPRAVGTAPERNKLRRQLKAIFYEEKLYSQPMDLLIILKKGAVRFDFDQLKRIIMKYS
jgi:ribonuclease P protein component